MRAGYGVRSVTAALAAQLLWAGAAVGQVASEDAGPGFDLMPRVGIGYVANAPEITTGGAAWAVFDVLGGLGLYVDFKLNLDTPARTETYIEGVTPTEVEAVPNQGLLFTDQAWWSANAAIVRPISNELMLYFGAGYSELTVYNRYRDEAGIFLPDDWEHGIAYWVKDGRRTDGRINVVGGAFFRLGSAVALQFGLEGQPFGMTVGGSYSVAFR